MNVRQVASLNTPTLALATLSGMLAAGGLGYATGDAYGGAIGVVAFALSVVVTFGLVRAIERCWGTPENTDPLAVGVGACAFAGWFVLASSVPLVESVTGWGYLAVVFLLGVALGARTDSAYDGCWHGAVAGGVGGTLLVFVAIYESFTMQPELDTLVVIAGVVAPLAFGVLGSLGATVGGRVVNHYMYGRLRT